jgi:hypothetical protein
MCYPFCGTLDIICTFKIFSFFNLVLGPGKYMTMKVGSGSGISYSGSTLLIVTIISEIFFLMKKMENGEKVTLQTGMKLFKMKLKGRNQ